MIEDRKTTYLEEAAGALSQPGRCTNAGTWLTLPGECCLVYVVQTNLDTYLTWCDSPGERTVELYHTPQAAIGAGLRRASGKVNTQ